jgi:HAD superfamily hydrolase (TIGR01549 family)
MNSKIKAIIWDYDGTLVDSRIKNLNVTRKIIEKATGKKYHEFPALTNLQNFELAHQRSENWRDFYFREFNFNEEQINNVGIWWTEFQLSDDTSVELFPGIYQLLSELKNYPQAIVSQNSRDNILNLVKKQNVEDIINCVVGFEEVKINRQKPFPDGLLKCLDYLGSDGDDIVLYIGDHETDTQLAYNTNQYFKNNGSQLCIISIGAFYIFPTNTSGWIYKPDYEANSTSDVLEIVKQFDCQS